MPFLFSSSSWSFFWHFSFVMTFGAVFVILIPFGSRGFYSFLSLNFPLVIWSYPFSMSFSFSILKVQSPGSTQGVQIL
jgi:hypothetical protein